MKITTINCTANALYCVLCVVFTIIVIGIKDFIFENIIVGTVKVMKNYEPV